MPNSIVRSRSRWFAVTWMIFGIVVLRMLGIIYSTRSPANHWLVFSMNKHELKEQHEIGHTMGFDAAPDSLVYQNARSVEVKVPDCAESSPDRKKPSGISSATSMRPTPILRSLQTPIHTPAPTNHFNLTSGEISGIVLPKPTNSVKETRAAARQEDIFEVGCTKTLEV